MSKYQILNTISTREFCENLIGDVCELSRVENGMYILNTVDGELFFEVGEVKEIGEIEKSYIIGFIYYDDNNEEQYIEKEITHKYVNTISNKNIEKYLVKKHEKIIADENNIDIDSLCLSRIIEL